MYYDYSYHSDYSVILHSKEYPSYKLIVYEKMWLFYTIQNISIVTLTRKEFFGWNHNTIYNISDIQSNNINFKLRQMYIKNTATPQKCVKFL